MFTLKNLLLFYFLKVVLLFNMFGDYLRQCLLFACEHTHTECSSSELIPNRRTAMAFCRVLAEGWLYPKSLLSFMIKNCVFPDSGLVVVQGGDGVGDQNMFHIEGKLVRSRK